MQSHFSEKKMLNSRVYANAFFLIAESSFSKGYPKLREVRYGCSWPSSMTCTHHLKRSTCLERRHMMKSKKDPHATSTPSLLIWVSMKDCVDSQFCEEVARPSGWGAGLVIRSCRVQVLLHATGWISVWWFRIQLLHVL